MREKSAVEGQWMECCMFIYARAADLNACPRVFLRPNLFVKEKMRSESVPSFPPFLWRTELFFSHPFNGKYIFIDFLLIL